MTDYTEAEQAEFDKLRTEFIGFKMAFSPLADLHAVVAHFAMKKLREERGFDFALLYFPYPLSMECAR